MNRRTMLAALLSFTLAACGEKSPPAAPPGPTLAPVDLRYPPETAEDAIVIAKRAMIRAREVPQESPDVSAWEAEAERNPDGGWTVFLTYVPHMPGGHCTVILSANGEVLDVELGA